MTPILLSIVIPTRNRCDLLLETLDALHRQSADAMSFEIRVVADGCTDGTAHAVRALAGTPTWRGRTLVCVERKWGGAAAARNAGLQSASGAIVLFLDDDIMADKDLVAEHIARHAAAPSTGTVVLGRLVSGAGRGTLHRQLNRWWEDHYHHLVDRPPGFIDFFTGNVSVPRDAALAADGFDQDLDYAEDIELGYRLAALGLPFVYAPEACGHAHNLKSARALLRDLYRVGQGCVRIYHKLPATLPALPLAAYGETTLRLRLARGLLLRLAENPVAARALDECFALWARSDLAWGARQMFELVRSYYFWRGVRSAVPDRAEWRRLTSPGVPILLYHSVTRAGAAQGDLYTVTTRRFAQQLALLKLLGYQVVPLDALVARWDAARLPSPRSVAITFDDGYRDNLDDAWPLLRRFAYPATIFVVSGMVGGRSVWDAGNVAGTRPLLDWEQLRRLDREGFRVAAHSVSHADLTVLDAEAVAGEIEGSRRDLEDRLGHSVELFAYPYGLVNGTLQAQAAQAGYKAALSVESGLNTLRTPRFVLRRIQMRGDDNLFMFLLKLWVGDDPLRRLSRWRRRPRGSAA